MDSIISLFFFILKVTGFIILIKYIWNAVYSFNKRRKCIQTSIYSAYRDIDLTS